ncbi:hypothetical protein SDJN03_19921, partial [Cucurbita argyrosperma subsp. sororia]
MKSIMGIGKQPNMASAVVEFEGKFRQVLCFWASRQAQFVVIRPRDPVVHPPIKFTVNALLSSAIEMKLLFLLHMAAPAHSSSSHDRRHLGSLSCRLCHASSDTPGFVRERIDDEDEVFSFQTL